MNIRTILNLLNFITLIAFILLNTYFDSEFFNEISIVYSSIYYLLILISLNIPIVLLKAEILFIHIVFYVYYGFRMFFISFSENYSLGVGEYDFMRYEFLTELDFQNASYFLILTVLIFISFQIFLFTRKKVRVSFSLQYYSKELERIILYLVIALVLFKGVYTYFGYNELIGKAWPNTFLFKIVLYFVEYTKILIIFTFFTFCKNYIYKYDNFLPSLAVLLILVSGIPTGGKGLLIQPVMFLLLISMYLGVYRVRKKFILFFVFVVIFTGFMSYGQHIFRNFISEGKHEMFIKSSVFLQDSSEIYKQRNLNSVIFTISNLSKRLGGYDWLAMSQSAYFRYLIGNEVTLTKTSNRIIDRFIPNYYKNKALIPNGRIIAEGIRNESKESRAHYSEYFTFFGYIGFYGFYGALFFWIFMYLVYKTRMIKNPYMAIAISSSLILNFFMSGDTPSLVKSTVVMIFVFQFWVLTARIFMGFKKLYILKFKV